MGTKRVKESAYLFLKEHYQAHKEPHHYEHNYADEDIERAALLHQTVDVVEHQGDKQYVDDVFYSECEHIF